jgi:tetratricopeptide (TPR) repeat protein
MWITCLVTLGLSALPAHADNLEDANQSFKAGQHAKALEQVNRHLAGKPKDAQGRFLKGIILTGMNKSDEAITIFKKLTEDYPELPEPYNNLAVIYAQQKQYDKAKQSLEMAIRTHPAYATAHENLGDIYSRLASDAYGKALQIDSSNASAQTKLSMINELVGGSGGARDKVGADKTALAANTASGKPVTPSLPPVAAPAPVAPVMVARAETKVAESAKPAPPRAPPVPAKPAEAKQAESKPVPEPVKPEPNKANDINSEVTAAVDGWIYAWSKKDVKTYLSHYARDFQTPDGLSRKAWETERSQRVGKPGKIEVGRDKLTVKAEGTDKVVVRFRQNYKSPGFSSSSGKTLVLVKRDGKWLIQEERVGG